MYLGYVSYDMTTLKSIVRRFVFTITNIICKPNIHMQDKPLSERLEAALVPSALSQCR